MWTRNLEAPDLSARVKFRGKLLRLHSLRSVDIRNTPWPIEPLRRGGERTGFVLG